MNDTNALLEKFPFFYGKIPAAKFPDSFFLPVNLRKVEIYGKVSVK